MVQDLDLILEEKEHLQQKEEELIYSKIHLIKNMLYKYIDSYNGSPEYLKRDALAYYEQLASAEKTHLHFALNRDGVMLRSGTDNTFAGANLIHMQDTDGIYFIKEMVAATEIPDGVYVTYHWPKVKGGEPLKKTSYCLYIPELDIIIGTGSYEEDILEQLKTNVYERLQSYYADKEDYIFVTTYDGKALVSVILNG